MSEEKTHGKPEKSTRGTQAGTRVVSRKGKLELVESTTARHSYTPWAGKMPALLRGPGLVIVAATVLLLVSAIYTVVAHLQYTPGSIYNQGITNSGNMIDTLAAYAGQLQTNPHKSTLLSASMKGSDILGHYTINLIGTQNANGNGLFSALGSVDGMPLHSSIRTVATAGNTLPDAYIKSQDLNALKPLVGVTGLPTFNQFDNKWILIDHNLLESYLDNLMRIADKHISTSKPVPGPTLAQLSNALGKVQTVNKQYLFTTDPGTAVLKNPSFLGTETIGGHHLNHYRVTYDTAHLATYLQALGQALDSSQLNAWSKQANQGKSLDEALDLAGLGSSAQQSGNADVWIDRGSKLITKVQVNNPSETLSSVVITLGDSAGRQYPFAVTYKGKDETGTAYTATVQVALNTDTHAVVISLDDRSQAHGLRSVMSARVSLTPSNNTVQVSAPTGAVPFLTALRPSGLSDLAKP